MLQGNDEVEFKTGDLRILYNDDPDSKEKKFHGIQVFNGKEFAPYKPLENLYDEKNPEGKRYSLNQLLSYAKKDGATNKYSYLESILEELNTEGFYKEDSPVRLYDNILVGRKVSGPSKKSKKEKLEDEYDEDIEPYDDIPEGTSVFDNYAELLKFNPNLILYGPPGTGKTYATTKIIESYERMTNGDKVVKFETVKEQGRVKFITFHQSYSYEEFIEGIKPVLNEEDTDNSDNKEISYTIENGILKQMAIDASRQLIETELYDEGVNDIGIAKNGRIWKVSLGQRNVEEDVYKSCKKDKAVAVGWLYEVDLTGKTYDEIFELLSNERNTNEKPTQNANSVNSLINEMQIGDVVLIYNSPTTIRDIGIINSDYYYDKENIDYSPHRRKVKWIKEFKEPFNIMAFNGNTRLTLKTVYELKRMDFSDIYKILFGDVIKNTEIKKDITDKPYYLIIDEINRGNIAKIFGELITLIEKDKRGTTETYLPYSKKPFSLPPNLYIIGTMNTADRSIAILDTALRRRFVFAEMTPELSVFDNSTLCKNNVTDKISLQSLLKVINHKIMKYLDRDHRIGHAHLLRIFSIRDLYYVWYYTLIPLLCDYFYNDFDRLKQIIGNKFFDKNGDLIFLNTRGEKGSISEFEQALLETINEEKSE